MKKTVKLFVTLFALVLFANVSFAQPTTNIPQYTLSVQNANLVDPNNLVFDLVFTHTDAIPLELAGWQFFFRIPVGIGTLGFLTGANSSFVYDSTGGDAISDLPVAFRPRNPSAANSGGTHYELRTAANTLPGAGNGLIIPQGVPTLIGRYKIKSTTPIDLNNPLIIRDSCEVPLSVTRTKLNWYNENSFNQEFTRCASHSVENNGVLPVELASFTSSISRNNVTLNWSTSSETNNSGFDIERSLVGTTEWTKAGNVTGNGTTTEMKNYSFSERVNTGKYNYRLKQIDFNGNFEYFNLSSEITVGVPDAYKLSQNYPNPFNPSTKIDYDLPYDGKVSILLYDISGREVASLVNEVKTAGYYTATFNGANLASGMYFYRINATGTGNNNFVSTKKMVLIK
ncbi:MAG TPA: T9SS type A sorting domain-containing protein [Ignavibacteria bacterium]|nr:T9SS type A sorting domain-containing protein [Ignavibacteria bacterium]HRJ99999.1 T9SS type A sorting domain-containing protein [Ignavibacteria bacterium]